MQIEVFSLCDAATVDGGKLNILGAFDTIGARNIPVVHPQCAIALRVRFDSIERGQHRVVVNVVDVDGANVIPPAHGTIDINFSDEQRSGSANLIINIQMLKLQRFGEHSIDLAIDGRVEGSLPLFVRQL